MVAVAAVAGTPARARVQPGAGDRAAARRDRSDVPDVRAASFARARPKSRRRSRGPRAGATCAARLPQRRRGRTADRDRRRRDDDRRDAGGCRRRGAARRRAVRGRVGGRAYTLTAGALDRHRESNMCAVVLALLAPEIPPNTGNVIRLAANTGDRAASGRAARLPHGRPRSEARRARLSRVRAVYACTPTGRVHVGARGRAPAISRSRPGRSAPLRRALSRPGDVLVFGCETVGLPDAILGEFAPESRLRIPMRPALRSLNLSNAVAVTVYEAWRQAGSRRRRARSLRPLGQKRVRRAQAVCRPSALKLRPGLARKQRSSAASRRHVLVQHAIDRLGDRHVDAVSAPASTCGALRGGHAFGDVAELGQRSRASASPRPRRQSDAPVAREVAGAGQHQVSQARQTRSASRVCRPARRRAARLGETARDQRGARVVAEAQAVARAGGDREHVLDRAADLDAGQVVADVGAQRRRRAAARATDRGKPGVGRRDAEAVGRPRATSSAKLGPEITPTGDGHIGATMRCASATPGGSAAATKPLLSQTSGARVARATPARGRSVRRPASPRRSARRRQSRATDPIRLRSQRESRCRVDIGLFSRAAAIDRAAAGSRAHRRSTGGAGTRARCTASAVPQAPAPTIATVSLIERAKRRGYRPQTCAMRT